MQRHPHIHPLWYAITDYFSASLAWMLFFFLRKKILGQELAIDERFWLGILLKVC